MAPYPMAPAPMALHRAAPQRTALHRAALYRRALHRTPWGRTPRRRPGGGFTLVEVMIALVVFAVLGFAVSARVGDVVNQTYSLERRTVAHWIAMNQLTRLRIQNEGEEAAVPTGRNRERVFMSGREWLLDVEVIDTAHPWLRRVELSVSLIQDDREIGPIDHVTGFLGRY